MIVILDRPVLPSSRLILLRLGLSKEFLCSNTLIHTSVDTVAQVCLDLNSFNGVLSSITSVHPSCPGTTLTILPISLLTKRRVR